MRRMFVIGAAALVLGLGAAAWAQTGSEESAGENGESTGKAWEHPVRVGLDGVLADLVEDGTITQIQADAIIAAVEERRSAARAAREEFKALLDAFWDDGVLTADEIAQLPNADRITAADGPFSDALSDGQITKEEMEEINGRVPDRRGHHGRGHHGGPGKGFRGHR
ncbi:hypothetical protein [Candidatus Spongiisocius sp.]|uniref:hypothetical protein n=1 Tax=Candidatus Spongiisocius sp. TaxID=3101273 RepID=UPI003B58F6D7